jgi:hypothetical protein
MSQMPQMLNNKEESVKDSLPSDKPKYVDVNTNNSSNVTVSKFPKNGIEVVALRKGFYNQNRIEEGQVFLIKDKEQFGTWMKCTDPDMERERIKFFNNKKAKK